MLLRRSLFVLDIIVLSAVVVFLVLLPAERCANFVQLSYSNLPIRPPHVKCHLHPIHHPDFSFHEGNYTHLENVKHHVTICHQLQWSHFSFWDRMYLILLPAIACGCLILYTICEIIEFDLFVGRVQSTALICVSVLSVMYTIGVISHEKNRIRNDWPLLEHARLLGSNPEEITVDVPKTWQYSIAMCILSAAFKIGRILIQHFIGDKKIIFDDDTPSKDKTSRKPLLTYGNNLSMDNGEVAGTTRMLNESTFSRIEND